MLWKRKVSRAYNSWDQVPIDQRAEISGELLALCASLLERSGDLVVSPGSANSLSFLRWLLANAASLKASPWTAGMFESMRGEFETNYAQFGAWQRRSVEELIHDISESARNLIGTVSSAIEDGDETVSLLRKLTSGLESAKNQEDIVAMRQVIRMQIDIAKALVEKQAEIQKDLTEAQERELDLLEKKLSVAESASHTDYLTQLANRAAFDYYASAMIQKAKFEDADVAVAMLDLDSFKEINDTYGHAAGDAALNETSGLLKRFLGGQSFIARFGGDEFAVAWLGTSKELKGRLASLVRHISNRKIRIAYGEGREAEVCLGLSAGVAEVFEDDTLQSVLDRADKALYLSKKSGKGRVTLDGRQAA